MKQFYLIAILFFVSFFTTVVSSYGQAFKGGAAGGIVGSQVAGDTYSGYNKLGAYAGLWISLDLSERSSLKTELSYFQKGSRHNPDEKRQDFTIYIMRLGYIEMPFLYQYHLKSKIILEAGPSFSYLLHSYESLDKIELSYGKFKLFNPSFMAGIGFPLNEKISAYLRMDSSVLSIRLLFMNSIKIPNLPKFIT